MYPDGQIICFHAPTMLYIIPLDKKWNCFCYLLHNVFFGPCVEQNVYFWLEVVACLNSPVVGYGLLTFRVAIKVWHPALSSSGAKANGSEPTSTRHRRPPQVSNGSVTNDSIIVMGTVIIDHWCTFLTLPAESFLWFTGTLRSHA